MLYNAQKECFQVTLDNSQGNARHSISKRNSGEATVLWELGGGGRGGENLLSFFLKVSEPVKKASVLKNN